MARFSIWPVLLLMGGCGITSEPADSTPAEPSFAGASEPSPYTGEIGQFPPQSVASTAGSDMNGSNPFGFAIEASSTPPPDILGLLLDALIVDLLTPVGPRLDDSLTFLQRLCMARGEPDHFCRRRYGR